MNFKDELAARTAEANEILERYLPAEEGFASDLAEAMTYALKAGGKRLRPVLMKAVFDLCGGEGSVIGPFMAGMEMIHTHSLIHDDLPAIDNDDYRRGKLTVHKVYGEAMGVLSGDALLNYAYETMLRSFALVEKPERAVKALTVIAEKTGIHGMLGGQCVDVQNDGRPESASMLEYIYENKTSALIEASMMAGAILAGESDETVRLFEKAAGLIGLAFQITDDILDVIGDEKLLGKPVHSDEKNNKVTYVTIYGTEGAAKEAERLSEEASSLIASYGGENAFLLSFVSALVKRNS